MLGIVRKVDPVGRVVIPMEIRRAMDLKYGDPVEILADRDRIIIKKYSEICIFCNQSKNLKSFESKRVCQSCLKKLSSL